MWLWVILFLMIGVIVFMSIQKVEPFYVEESISTPINVIRITNNGATPFERFIQISQLAAFDMNGNNVAANQRTLSSGAGWDTSESTAVDGTLSARPWPNIYHGGGNGGEFWQVYLAQPTVLS